ncbi:MAG: DUF5320 domain-containing protein [Candidatus Brocadiia bacterium]
MPGGDGTGPLGQGPMTGRAAGYCAGYPVPGYMNPIPGRGAWGWGRGFGRGWGRGRAWGAGPWAYAPPAYPPPAYGPPAPPWPQVSPEQEGEMLKRQAEALRAQLDAIQKRMDELAAQDTSE